MQVRMSMMANPHRDDMFGLADHLEDLSTYFKPEFDIFKFRAIVQKENVLPLTSAYVYN